MVASLFEGSECRSREKERERERAKAREPVILLFFSRQSAIFLIQHFGFEIMVCYFCTGPGCFEFNIKNEESSGTSCFSLAKNSFCWLPNGAANVINLASAIVRWYLDGRGLFGAGCVSVRWHSKRPFGRTNWMAARLSPALHKQSGNWQVRYTYIERCACSVQPNCILSGWWKNLPHSTFTRNWSMT